MDSLMSNRFTTTTLLVLGTNPLIVAPVFGSLLFRILQYPPRLLPFLPRPGMIVTQYLGPILAIGLLLLSLAICIKNIERVGYKKIDIVRLFIPIYGIYFAFQLASRFTMSDEELAQGSTNPSSGGMTF
jgi:hypothetical protein